LRFQTVGELAVALAAFAPDHARVWAERCCYVLKNAEAARTEPEEVLITRPRSGSSGGVAISIAAPPMLASQDEEVVSFRPASPYRRMIVPAVIGVAIGAWFAFRTPANSATVTAPQPSSPPPLPSATAPVAVPEDKVAVPEPSPVAPPEASAAPLVAPRIVRKPPASPPKPPASKEKTAPPPSARPSAPLESEPDVGF
jgi:hypothetical protein